MNFAQSCYELKNPNIKFIENIFFKKSKINDITIWLLPASLTMLNKVYEAKINVLLKQNARMSC